MIKEEAIKKAASTDWFLEDYPKWNNDREVVMAAVKRNGIALQYASKELKNDKDIVMAAVKQNGYSLQHSSNELKNDKRVVMAAVKQNGIALQFASDKLRDDKEVVMVAVQQIGCALYYASTELRKNKNFILEIIKRDTGISCYSLLEEYQTFEEIIEKEGEAFLFSCWNNLNPHTRLKVAKHPDYLPTTEQIRIITENKNELNNIKEIYQLRQNEWLAKIEEKQIMEMKF